MSGYLHRLTVLRAAANPHADKYEMPFEPHRDYLLRRLAQTLTDDQAADVVELIKLARTSP